MKIFRVITNITEYLYNKYGQYKSVSKEVIEMVTTLYNPLIKEEGKREGIIEGKIEDILELLEDHGSIPEDLKARIKAESNIETLKRWFKIAAKAGSIDEFIQRMNTSNPK